MNFSNSRRFTSFLFPTYNTNGHRGVFSSSDNLFCPILLYSAASSIVSVVFSQIGTSFTATMYHLPLPICSAISLALVLPPSTFYMHLAPSNEHPSYKTQQNNRLSILSFFDLSDTYHFLSELFHAPPLRQPLFEFMLLLLTSQSSA